MTKRGIALTLSYWLLATGALAIERERRDSDYASYWEFHRKQNFEGETPKHRPRLKRDERSIDRTNQPVQESTPSFKPLSRTERLKEKFRDFHRNVARIFGYSKPTLKRTEVADLKPSEKTPEYRPRADAFDGNDPTSTAKQ